MEKHKAPIETALCLLAFSVLALCRTSLYVDECKNEKYSRLFRRLFGVSRALNTPRKPQFLDTAVFFYKSLFSSK